MVLATTLFALSLTISEALGVRLCGKQLADMLDLVCDGRGFHWSPRTSREYNGVTTSTIAVIILNISPLNHKPRGNYNRNPQHMSLWRTDGT